MLREEIKKEIRYYGFSDKDAEIIREKEGISVIRVQTGEGTAILEYFENEAFRREIKNYDILAECGIPTIKVLGMRSCSILLEDLARSETYRLGTEEDLKKPSAMQLCLRYPQCHLLV